MAKIQAPFIETIQGRRTFFLTRLPAGVVAEISYAAVRGKTDEEGAIQRVLNSSRIASIKEFALSGGDFPNAVILNWVNTTNPIKKTTSKISFESIRNCAQIIDGQHRIAGIHAAIADQPSLSDLMLPVVIYTALTTKECADIFLAINTEQKPVPRSLVYDLYGIASEELVDPAAVRARDIAMYLNDDPTSPYKTEIKLPGDKTRKGGIALSTAVAAIKPLVEEKGVFEQIEIVELETQKQIILNLFAALRAKYTEEWNDKNNAFMYAAGFAGALDFLKLRLIPYCSQQRSFKISTIEQALDLSKDTLITQSDLKGFGGSSAQRQVFDRLVQAFRPSSDATPKFEI